MSRKEPLRVEIRKGVLSIMIGVETLGHAIELSPKLERYNDESEDFDHPVIVNADVFAKEIMVELSREEEDGTTPVHRMLDSVAMFAIEQGASGVRMPDDA
jgi:hypothetical protein